MELTLNNVTPPNSPENVPVSIDDQESSSESPNLSIDTPPLLPLRSDVDQSEDDEFDTSIDSIPPLPPSVAHQVCSDSTLPDAQPTISNYTDPAQRVISNSQLPILLQPPKQCNLDQSHLPQSSPISPQLQPSKPLSQYKEERKSLFSEVLLFKLK